jgi:DHA1 family inner membrane transport protein
MTVHRQTPPTEDGGRHACAMPALVALAVLAFAFVTTESLPIGLLLPMSSALHASRSSVGLLVSAYALVVVATTIPMTWVTRRAPRRRVFCTLIGMFIVACAVTSVSSSYGTILFARVLSALSQAVFWALVIPTAASLVTLTMRGRALAAIFGGSALANTVGVPGGTWLGQHAGWHAPFLALGAVGAGALATIALSLPGADSRAQTVELGETPDARRFWLLVAVTGVATIGAFLAFTYIVPFLTAVTGLHPSAVGPVLLIRGAASIIGVVLGGQLADRRPGSAVLAAVALQACALLAMWIDGSSPVLAIICLSLCGMAFTAMTTALAARLLQLSPISLVLAAATTSTAVNIGISSGAFAGGIILAATGARQTALAAGIVTVIAVGTAITERLAPRQPKEVVPVWNTQTGARDTTGDLLRTPTTITANSRVR